MPRLFRKARANRGGTATGYSGRRAQASVSLGGAKLLQSGSPSHPRQRRQAILPSFASRASSLLSRLAPWRASSDRSDYKGTWNRLSASEDDAKLGVAGLTDEAALAASAATTVELLRSSVGIRPEDTVLEIGAGVGRVGAALAPLCRKWIGADVSRHMVAHIRRRLADLPNVEAVEISGYDLAAIPSGSVDLVYSTVVFMHLEEWDRYNYVLESFRVLRPGGRLLVDNVNLLSDEGWAIFEAHRRLKPERRTPSISKTSTPQELETYLRRAGFERIEQRDVLAWIVTYGVKPASA